MADFSNKLSDDVKKIAPVAAGLVLVLVLVYFWKSFYVQIESNQRGVVLQLGSLKSRPLGPGAHFRLPYPIQDIYKVDVVNDRKLYIGFTEGSNGQKRHLEREALTLTRFGNLVELEMEVNYFISDPGKYLLRMEDPDLTVKQAAEWAMRSVVGLFTISDVLTEKKRDIVEQIQIRLQEVLNSYNIGIQVRRVQFVKAVNPASVLEAFESVENAKQDSGKAYLEAERYANQQLPQARGQARKQLEEAKAFAESIIATAKGDSSRFSQLLAKYQKYPKVTRKRLYLETMQNVLPGVKKIIVDEHTGSLNLLPLKKL